MAIQYKTGNRNLDSPPLELNVYNVIRYLPDWLKTEALCLAAVQKDGMALEFVPPALQDKVQKALKNR